jgi:hypothetical protein
VPFELGRPPDIGGGDVREIGVLFKTLGGDHVPEQINHFFGLQSVTFILLVGL